MAHAALFAFTSRHEGLGFVLIEALAVGRQWSRPTARAAQGKFSGRKYGELVPVGAVDTLAGAMARVLDTPRLLLIFYDKPQSLTKSSKVLTPIYEYLVLDTMRNFLLMQG